MTTVQTDNGNSTESLVHNTPNTRQVAEYIRKNLLIPTIESASKQFEQYLSGQPIGITSTTSTASNNNTSNTNTNTTTGGDSSDGGKENKQMKNSLPTEISNRVLELIKEKNVLREYKLLVTTEIGESKQAGKRMATKCYWDNERDLMVQYKQFMGDNIYCIIVVFGIKRVDS